MLSWRESRAGFQGQLCVWNLSPLAPDGLPASSLSRTQARELEAGSPSQLTLKAPGRRRTGNTKGPFDFFERRLGRKVEEPGKQFVSWDSSVEDFRTYFPHPVKPVGPLENFPSKAATPVLQT